MREGLEMMTTAPFPQSLEDDFNDVLRKAQKGLKLSLEEISERSGVAVPTVRALWDGIVDVSALEKVAFVLNLHPESLVVLAEKRWLPKPVEAPVGLACFTTWFGDMTVNAYLVWDPATGEAASFDTGASAQPMMDFLQAHSLKLTQVFITHTHADHLADLERLCQFAGAKASAYGSAIENPLGLKPLHAGDGLVLGSLRIRVLGTFGHTPGGLSYWVQGLARPLVVVGDALFAGSMGGATYAYQDALRNNREQLLALPPDTVICPGHGPLSTVGEECQHNPFFPEYKGTVPVLSLQPGRASAVSER